MTYYTMYTKTRKLSAMCYTDSVAEWIRVVAFETVRLRDQEGVGSIPGPGQGGGVFIPGENT